MTDRATTAHHEAGHAFMATLLGLRPAMVSVRPHSGALGRMHFSLAAQQAADPFDPAAVARFAAVALAGPLAESRYVQGPGWRLRNLDVQGFRAFGGARDLEDVQVFSTLEDDPDRAALLVRRWRLLTAYKVVRHWEAVTALASELEHRGALTGGEVETVLAAGGHLRRRSLDPDKVIVKAGGRPQTLRQWAAQVDRGGARRFALAVGKGN